MAHGILTHNVKIRIPVSDTASENVSVSPVGRMSFKFNEELLLVFGEISSDLMISFTELKNSFSTLFSRKDLKKKYLFE